MRRSRAPLSLGANHTACCAETLWRCKAPPVSNLAIWTATSGGIRRLDWRPLTFASGSAADIFLALTGSPAFRHLEEQPDQLSIDVVVVLASALLHHEPMLRQRIEVLCGSLSSLQTEVPLDILDARVGIGRRFKNDTERLESCSSSTLGCPAQRPQGESGVRTPCADFDPDFLTLANSLYQKTPLELT